jgi:hypothetical protein
LQAREHKHTHTHWAHKKTFLILQKDNVIFWQMSQDKDQRFLRQNSTNFLELENMLQDLQTFEI